MQLITGRVTDFNYHTRVEAVRRDVAQLLPACRLLVGFRRILRRICLRIRNCCCLGTRGTPRNDSYKQPARSGAKID